MEIVFKVRDKIKTIDITKERLKEIVKNVREELQEELKEIQKIEKELERYLRQTIVYYMVRKLKSFLEDLYHMRHIIPFPDKKYKTIYADPPWPEYGGGKIKRGADRHYKLMSIEEIKNLPVRDLADTNCHLYL